MANPPKRMRRLRKGLAIAAGALLLLGGVAVVVAGPMGGGYASKIACSELFVAGRKLADVEREDLAPFGFVSLSVDEDAKVVTGKLLGLYGAKSVYRDGLGCAVAASGDIAHLREQAVDLSVPKEQHQAPWPKGAELHPDPIDGLNRAALDAAVAQAFEEPDPDELRRTRAVVVVYDGKLVAERYAEGFDRTSRLLGWSMTKSVTNALVGVAAKRGLLTIQDVAGFASWTDERKHITIDHLLRMSSGLAFDETYQPLTDATAMLFETEDAAAAAMAHEQETEPDTVWSYSSGTTNLLSKILRERLGDDAAYHRFPYEGLFGPLGMTSARIEADGSGTFVGSSFMYATAQDWARFGLLFANDGVTDGKRILPQGWVDYSRRPTPPAPNGRYGAQFWLNAGRGEEPKPFPSLPNDLFYASGYQGQKVAIFPSHDAVIVRLGMTHSRTAFPFEAIARAILDALPSD